MEEQNPFHERELTQEEFQALLGERFSTLALFAQRTAMGSRIERLGTDGREGHLDVQIERVGDDWRPAAAIPPLYVIAVASNAPLPELPGASTLSDFGVEALRQAEQERDRAGSERDRLAGEVASLARQLDDERRRADAAAVELARVQSSVVWSLFQRARSRFYGAVGQESRAGRTVSAALRRIGRRL